MMMLTMMIRSRFGPGGKARALSASRRSWGSGNLPCLSVYLAFGLKVARATTLSLEWIDGWCLPLARAADSFCGGLARPAASTCGRMVSRWPKLGARGG